MTPCSPTIQPRSSPPPHFHGYAAILVRLDHVTIADLAELIVEAWLIQAPKRLAKQYLDNPP